MASSGHIHTHSSEAHAVDCNVHDIDHVIRYSFNMCTIVVSLSDALYHIDIHTLSYVPEPNNRNVVDDSPKKDLDATRLWHSTGGKATLEVS